MSEQQFEEIRTRLGGLEGTTGGLVRDLTDLKMDMAILKTDVKDLRRQMDVFHEEVLDRLAEIQEDDSLRREMQAGFADLRQLFLDHTTPGEAVDRQAKPQE